MTPKQQQRQKHRNGGKYAQVNPCYRCGKSAGEDYLSSKNTDQLDELGNDWNDIALCLCEPCAVYLDRLPAADAWRDVKHPEYGNHKQGRSPAPAGGAT